VDETPDYRSMSRSDLEDVARHIDRQAFPERWAIVRDELRLRAAEPREAEPRTEQPRRVYRTWPWRRIIAISQFTGALTTAGYLGQTSGLSLALLITVIVLDLWAAIELWRRTRRGLWLSLFVQAIQVVNISIRPFAFVVRNGLFLIDGVTSGNGAMKLTATGGFDTWISIGLPNLSESFVIVNVLAVSACAYLIRTLRTRIRPMRAAELNDVATLATRVFDESIAPTYSAEGIASYRDYATAVAFASRVHDHRLLVAERGGELVGMLELRGPAHVSMLFVSSREQRRGIGRMLLAAAEAMSDAEIITLNATPNAVPAYVRLGFNATGEEQERSGIRFVPMSRRKCGK
jgi:ribosomal protein S18 acetylase RimI-like enzyme